jgi:uncharacterized membrane protein
MNDTRSAARDDAPATTAKSRSHDPATDALVEDGGKHVVGHAVTINRPRAELYAYWRDLERLPDFMDNVEHIEVLDDKRSHWVAKAPGGRTVEWDARITEERDSELIAWASEEGADVSNAGRIEFRDAGLRGTVVTAMIAYNPPAGTIGKLVAKLFQREPAIQARRDLRRFKQLMKPARSPPPRAPKSSFERRRPDACAHLARQA